MDVPSPATVVVPDKSSATLSEFLNKQIRRAHICRFPSGKPAHIPRDLPFADFSHGEWWTARTRAMHEVSNALEAYRGMSTDKPLTLTVEQAAEVLGVGRSTAYELARTGDLRCIRLGRRIVVPVARLAESLGVDLSAVWSALGETGQAPASASTGEATDLPARPTGQSNGSKTPSLF
jgi:excisionase family DNA binding protein